MIARVYTSDSDITALFQYACHFCLYIEFLFLFYILGLLLWLSRGTHIFPDWLLWCGATLLLLKLLYKRHFFGFVAWSYHLLLVWLEIIYFFTGAFGLWRFSRLVAGLCELSIFSLASRWFLCHRVCVFTHKFPDVIDAFDAEVGKHERVVLYILL